MLRWFRLEPNTLSQNPDEKLLYDRITTELRQLEHDLASNSPPKSTALGPS